MIVKQAWVAKWTFYLYYKNKETLYEEIMDDILACWTQFMNNLVEKAPDVKERLYYYMIWSLWFFQKNEIVKNLINWNPDYFIWKINVEYLNSRHRDFMKLLLWNEFRDEKFVEFLANTKSFFAGIINHKICFQNESDYEKFVMNFAWVVINGLFSDYESFSDWKTFNELTSHVPKISK